MMQRSDCRLRAALSMGTLLVLWMALLASAPAALESFGDGSIRVASETPAAIARTPVRFTGFVRRAVDSPNPQINYAAPLAEASDVWNGPAHGIRSGEFVEQAFPRPRRLARSYDATAPPTHL